MKKKDFVVVTLMVVITIVIATIAWIILWTPGETLRGVPILYLRAQNETVGWLVYVRDVDKQGSPDAFRYDNTEVGIQFKSGPRGNTTRVGSVCLGESVYYQLKDIRNGNLSENLNLTWYDKDNDLYVSTEDYFVVPHKKIICERSRVDEVLPGDYFVVFTLGGVSTVITLPDTISTT